MTEDDKALVERLREGAVIRDDGRWTTITRTTALEREAADRIEAIIAENERLCEALQDVSAIWRRHKYSGDFDLWLNAHIRAALGDTK